MSSAPSSPTLNWREIDLVLGELALAGSLVQEVHQPAHDRIVIDLFRPRGRTAAGSRADSPAGSGTSVSGERLSLLVCLSSRFPRLHAITTRPTNPAKAPRFAMFLRAHIRGGKIVAAEQVRGGPRDQTEEEPRQPAITAGERIVRISVARGDERKVLWARLWASAANLIVTDETGLILDAFYRRPKRGEVSGGSYRWPPARQSESADETAPAASWAEQAPGSARREFTIREIAGEGSFNQRLERHFQQLESAEEGRRLAAQVDAELAMREAKLAATLAKLEARSGEYANLERWRELGDLITSNMHLVKKGARWLRVEDWRREGAAVEIELAPGLSPAQNAERYYQRYRKARDGGARLREDIEALRRALAEVEGERARLEAHPDVRALREARKAAGRRAPAGRGRPKEVPGLAFISASHRILVGRSARENDELLRHHVRGNDWWFHARDWAGAYVFVKSVAGKSLPLEVMLDAANLAIHFSRGKSAGRGDVYYTQVKYLRRAKDARRGLVLPTQEKNLSVKLDHARIERMKEPATPQQA